MSSLALVQDETGSKSPLDSEEAASSDFYVPASVPILTSFAEIADPRLRRAKEYEQYLLFALESFPEFGDRINSEITYARGQQVRTSDSDRERIVAALETESLTCNELSEDLEIPYATVYKILKRLLESGTVAAYERKGRAGNKPYLVYSLPH